LEPGVFLGQCAEFCGQAHAFMGIRVVVQPEADFNAWSSRWLAGDVGAVPGVPLPEDPLVTRGRQVFLTESTCIVCHSVSGTPAQGRIGPDLTLFGNRTALGAGRLANTPENLALWIRDPRGVKPGAEMPGTAYPLDRGTGPVPTWPATGLGEEQLAAVVAYLSSLR
jgi:cytochrome c oxidase subunit 2